MNYENLISLENYYISFKRFDEVQDSKVALRVIVYGCDNETELLIADPNVVDVWQIDFSSYATYSVTYEDFLTTDYDEIFLGNAFRIYEKSELMRNLKKRTNLEVQEARSGKTYRHFSLNCMEHQIDIVSNEQPIIKMKN